MRSDLSQIEKIEKYLDGSLSSEEYSEFEQQMAADADLQNKVNFQKQFVQGIQRADIKMGIVAASVKYKKLLFFSKLGLIAGAVVVGSAITVAVIKLSNNNNANKSLSNNALLNDSISHVTITYEQPKIDSIHDFVIKNNLSNDKNNSIGVDNNLNSSNIKVKENKPIDTKAKKDDTKLSDLFLSEGVSMTWLGVDFTECKFYGNFSETTDDIHIVDSKIANKSFSNWNDVYLLDKKKYDLKNAFYANQIIYYPDIANKRNDTINTQRLNCTNETELNHLDTSKIAKIAQSYDLSGREGLGLIFIAESINKLKQKNSIWVTIINMKTKEVLLSEKMLANPSGIGTKNYWSHSFYTIINTIEVKKYNEWKKTYKM